MALNLTNFDAALKEIYTNDKVEDLVYKNNPWLAMIPKMEKFEGDNLPIPVLYGNPQGRSATFADAQNNKTNTKSIKFNLTRTSNYSLADIDAETALASRSNAGAFLSAMTTEIDGAFHSLERSLSTAMYRDGGGTIGQIVNTSGTTIDLNNDADVVNFEVGMELNLYSAATGGSVRGSGLNIDVTAVDRMATSNQLTVAANVTGWTGITTLDFLVVDGDYDNMLTGLAGWLPTSITSGESFFGVDRFPDETRLGGVYYDGSADTIEDAIVHTAAMIGREGGRPDCAFVSFNAFRDLELSLGAKVQRDQVSTGKFGFSSIKIHAPTGTIDVIPDVACQNDRVWLVQLNTWKLYSLGKCPQILMQDGLRIMRNASADSYEVRIGYYAEMGCRAPGWNGSCLITVSS